MLKDKFGRIIDYIRISVTDRCNLRCIYCMPEEGIKFKDMGEILTYEDIVLFLERASSLGIKKVRLTGGEPLVRRDIEKLIEMIKNVEGIREICLTTNGTLLKKKAYSLYNAGINRITVSLDSLDERKYRYITRLGNVKDVLEGLKKIKDMGFKHTKINTVVMKGINDDETIKLLEFALSMDMEIRFIEYMPTKYDRGRNYFISNEEIKKKIKEKYQLEISSYHSNGPAEYFKIKNNFVGFISPLSKNFCKYCNRIRLSSDGFIIPCLGHDIRINVRDALRKQNIEEIDSIIKHAVSMKPKQHAMLRESISESMSYMGG